MEISIDQLLSGKATQIKNKEYYETARYVEPFLEKMSKLTDNFIINVKLPDQVTKTKDAEVYKVLEFQTLEDKVDAYIDQLKEKTAKKLKKLKHQEKLEDYILKYPESFIKVM